MRDFLIGLFTIIILDPYRGLNYDIINEYLISEYEVQQCAIVWCNQDECETACLGDKQKSPEDEKLDNTLTELLNYIEV